MFCNIGYAEITFIEGKTLKTGEWESFRVDTVCVSHLKEWGRVFVITRNMSGTISTVQYMERRDGKSVPILC